MDGNFESEGRKYVCEYHGCTFQGCIQCFPRDREITMNNGKSIAQRYRDTMVKKKIERIRVYSMKEMVLQLCKRLETGTY